MCCRGDRIRYRYFQKFVLFDRARIEGGVPCAALSVRDVCVRPLQLAHINSTFGAEPNGNRAFRLLALSDSIPRRVDQGTVLATRSDDRLMKDYSLVFLLLTSALHEE